ncbi:MAG: uracil-DNA glycosylase, partial [Acidobacteriota bacterium]
AAAPARARPIDTTPVRGLFDPEPEPVRPPAERRAMLQTVEQEAKGCTACRLCERRNHVVFGVGDPNADLMFVGEGPGEQEDRRGEPFVGPAGQLLDKIIRAIDLDRPQVYIANVVKCRPPGNRNPQVDEVAACRGYLERQIDLVQPKVIVALGKVAAQALLGSNQSLGRMRNVWHRVRGVETRVTYHPAALLRNPGWKRPTWEDMQLVRDHLRALQAERDG